MRASRPRGAGGVTMLQKAFNTAAEKTFFSPGRLWAGDGISAKLPEFLPPGPRLVVADARFANHPALDAWTPDHIALTEGEPLESRVMELIGALGQQRFAAVIALGGGSTIDAAKALHAKLSFGSIDVRDQPRPHGAPVLIAVPTTAGSGSETSRFFILGEMAKGTKRARRAWSFAPDLAVLDPQWLRAMPESGLVLGAFDAFIHLWETFVCRNERSPYTDALTLTGIPKIAAALAKLNAGQPLDANALQDLQIASAQGGIAISNVRTGLIHTLAESLSPLATLLHPETLWVFYAHAVDSYRRDIQDRIALLDAALGGPGGLHRLDRTWGHAFDRLGLSHKIRAEMAAARPDIDALMANAMRDTVLLKENPSPLDWSAVRAIAVGALNATRRAA